MADQYRIYFIARFLARGALIGARRRCSSATRKPESAEPPLHLWQTRMPGTVRPGPAGSASTTSCYAAMHGRPSLPQQAGREGRRSGPPAGPGDGASAAEARRHRTRGTWSCPGGLRSCGLARRWRAHRPGPHWQPESRFRVKLSEPGRGASEIMNRDR
jgi:hypothetical protein